MDTRARFFSTGLTMLALLSGLGRALAVAPANDGFAAATDLGALVTVTTAGTTFESGYEPAEPIYTGTEQSVWFKWTAPAAGWKRLTVTSTETTIANTPGVAVFQGTSLNNLTAVGVDLPGGPVARFNAVSGTVYYIQVVEAAADAGAFSIAVASTTAPAPPANDNFTGATTITASLPRAVTGTFLDATVEAREPNAYVSTGRSTVWYKWTPSTSNLVDIYGTIRAFARLKLYTGTTLANLVEVAPRYLDASYPEAYYQVTSGTTYYIQLAQNRAADAGFTLNLTAAPALTSPVNNNFSARVNLGNVATVSRTEQTSVDATTEAGEPLSHPNLTATVWYSWTAPTTGAVEIKTVGGANHDTFIGVWTGTTLATLALQASNDDIDADAGVYDSAVVLPVTANTVYQIQVGSAYGLFDTFDLTINPVDADLLPFRVLTFAAPAAAVNLTSVPATVTFDVTLSDLLQFEEDMLLALEMPAANATWGGVSATRFLEGDTAPVLVSGSTYRFTRTLPAGLPAGTYPIRIQIDFQTSGLADGVPVYGGKYGATIPGGVTALTITNTGTVLAPPVLTSFSMTPSSVDASLADVTVTLSASATGLPTTTPIALGLTNSLGIDAFFNPGVLTHNGTAWTASFIIRKGTRPMVYRPTLTLAGSALGRDYGASNALATALPAGSTTSFTIVNAAPDLMPPQLKNFTVDAGTVNLGAGDATLSGTLRLTDQTKVDFASIGIDDGTAPSYPPIVTTRLSGTDQDGVYRWTLVIPYSTAARGYDFVVPVDDGVGNALDLATFYLTWPLGFTSNFTVKNTSSDGAEVVWMAAQDFSSISGDDAVTATAVTTDPDKDGIPNLMEFYFGTNPADPANLTGAANLPVVSRTGGQLRLDFGQSAANLALGVLGSSVIGEYSPDLNTWTEVPVTATTPGFYRVTSPPGTAPAGYLRLKSAPLP